jgi:transposase
MAPTLRGARFHTPSLEPLANKEATTTRKCKFFDTLSQNNGTKSLRSISKECGIGATTGRDWKKQFENMGSLTKRNTRKRSSILGRKSRVTKSTCKMLVSLSRNPVQKQPLDAQIVFHNLLVKKRQLQRKLKENTKGGGRYLCTFIEKEISKKNRKGRTQYGDNHVYDSLFGFFDHIVYTDEAHIDPTSQTQGRVLREQETRDLPENIKERPPLKGVQFHIAAWISWYGKANKLKFYNDEEDHIEHPPIPPKPRRRPTTKTKEEFELRIKE